MAFNRYFHKKLHLDAWQVYEYSPETLISQAYGKTNWLSRFAGISTYFSETITLTQQ